MVMRGFFYGEAKGFNNGELDFSLTVAS